MEFDVSAFLDPSMELTVTVERSFNGDAGPWAFDFSYSRPGGAFLNDDGTPELIHHWETEEPDPTNEQRRIRGIVTIIGGFITTQGTLVFITAPVSAPSAELHPSPEGPLVVTGI